MQDLSGPPLFLENNPPAICDQIVWLVKHSNLNFQMKETPFSLTINLKKRFANHWNHDNLYKQHILKNPLQELLPGSQKTSQELHPDHLKTKTSVEKNELINEIHILKSSLDKATFENELTFKDLVEVEKEHKKLQKDYKDIQTKHEKVCLDLKHLKCQKEEILTLNNKLSVALKSSQKDLENKNKDVEAEFHQCKKELEKLKEFKQMKEEETKKLKKKEKKLKQKAIKEQNSKQKYLDEFSPISNTFYDLKLPGEDGSCFDIENNQTTKVINEDESKLEETQESSCFELECGACEECFQNEDELRAHRQIEHPGHIFTCTLCDQTFKTEEAFVTHRMQKNHMTLANLIHEQFMLQIGESCSECKVVEHTTDTSYQICDNDDHLDIFDNIWIGYRHIGNIKSSDIASHNI